MLVSGITILYQQIYNFCYSGNVSQKVEKGPGLVSQLRGSFHRAIIDGQPWSGAEMEKRSRKGETELGERCESNGLLHGERFSW